jgi:hypothetical protein
MPGNALSVSIVTSRNNPDVCSEVYEEFKKVSRLYSESGGMYPSGTGKGKKKAVFFGVIVGGNDTVAAFERLKVDDAPNILVSTPQIATLDEARLYASIGPQMTYEMIGNRI